MREKLDKWATRFLTVKIILISIVFFSAFLVFPVSDTMMFMEDKGVVERSSIDYVWVESEELSILSENFNESVEESFCLFGKVSHNSLKISEIDHVENPLSQTSTSISFQCRDEIKKRLSKLLLNPEYKLVATVHTHPVSEQARLSNTDLFTFGSQSILIRSMGVYSGEKLAFYSSSNNVRRPIHTYRVEATGLNEGSK